jgi:hypothetical protein
MSTTWPQVRRQLETPGRRPSDDICDISPIRNISLNARASAPTNHLEALIGETALDQRLMARRGWTRGEGRADQAGCGPSRSTRGETSPGGPTEGSDDGPGRAADGSRGSGTPCNVVTPRICPSPLRQVHASVDSLFRRKLAHCVVVIVRIEDRPVNTRAATQHCHTHGDGDCAGELPEASTGGVSMGRHCAISCAMGFPIIPARHGLLPPLALGHRTRRYQIGRHSAKTAAWPPHWPETSSRFHTVAASITKRRPVRETRTPE